MNEKAKPVRWPKVNLGVAERQARIVERTLEYGTTPNPEGIEEAVQRLFSLHFLSPSELKTSDRASEERGGKGARVLP